jgi:hypothetical protein
VIDLQELITRARFVFAGAPGRRDVFGEVDGKRTLSEIAVRLRRRPSNVWKDLIMLRDTGLIEVPDEQHGNGGPSPNKKRGLAFRKVPLARTIPPRYFLPTNAPPTRPHRETDSRSAASRNPKTAATRRPAPQRVPSETELLDLCKAGEDQTVEFKDGVTDLAKIVREIGAMANTSKGGLVLVGVSDAGLIQGAGRSRQQFDQPLQNSIRANIQPALTVGLHAVVALGSTVLVVVVPPWNRRDVYHFQERVLLRKGTSVFAAKPEESRRLHTGKVVV